MAVCDAVDHAQLGVVAAGRTHSSQAKQFSAMRALPSSLRICHTHHMQLPQSAIVVSWTSSCGVPRRLVTKLVGSISMLQASLIFPNRHLRFHITLERYLRTRPLPFGDVLFSRAARLASLE